MKNILFISLLFLFVALLAACSENQSSDPAILNKTINKSNLTVISEEISKSTNFTKEDMEYFINAITRYGNFPDSLLGKTVKQLIENEQKLNKSNLQEMLANTGARITLFMNHQFTYDGLQIDDSKPTQKVNNILFSIANISDKEIKHLEGILTFYDPTGNIVRVYNLSTDANIPVSKNGEGLKFGMPFLHNDNAQNAEAARRDSIIRNAKNLNAVWTPTLIKFSDNTEIKDLATTKQQAQTLK